MLFAIWAAISKPKREPSVGVLATTELADCWKRIPSPPKSFEVPFGFVVRCLDIISPLMPCAVVWTQAFAHDSMSGLEARRGSDPFDIRAAGQEVLRCAAVWTLSWTAAQWDACPLHLHWLRSSKPGGICTRWPAWLAWQISSPRGGRGGGNWNDLLIFISQIWARACGRPSKIRQPPSCSLVALVTERASAWPSLRSVVPILWD